MCLFVLYIFVVGDEYTHMHTHTHSTQHDDAHKNLFLLLKKTENKKEAAKETEELCLLVAATDCFFSS